MNKRFVARQPAIIVLCEEGGRLGERIAFPGWYGGLFNMRMAREGPPESRRAALWKPSNEYRRRKMSNSTVWEQIISKQTIAGWRVLL